MDSPLEISFHNMRPSEALKAVIHDHVQKLEKLHDHIIGCRVMVEMPHKNGRPTGNLPDVRIILHVPNREIVVSRELTHAGYKKAATDAYAVLDNAFAVAERRLKDHRRITHGKVKYKSGERRNM